MELHKFFSLTREKRWLIIKDVQRNFKLLCISEPAAKLEAHDEAKLGRAVATRDHEIATSLNRAVKFKEMDTIVPVTSVKALEALKVKIPRVIYLPICPGWQFSSSSSIFL